jgi:hypothetical protein
MTQRARLDAEAVRLAHDFKATGASVAMAGLSTDQLLSLTFKLTGGDVQMLLDAGDVLADMPATAALFRDGILSWSQLRGIIVEARRLPTAHRPVLDQPPPPHATVWT